MVPFLSCIFCHHVHTTGEVFVAHVKNNLITISECLECSHVHNHPELPEQEGGWAVVQFLPHSAYTIIRPFDESKYQKTPLPYET